MPFIIWGSRGLTKHLDRGRFYCPQCDRDDLDYDHKSVRSWFTMYFIPLFPIGGHEPYIECRRCGGTFKESVLDIEPPTDTDRAVAHYHEEMRRGKSVEWVEGELAREGMAADDAKKLSAAIGGDDTWMCAGCGHRYLTTVRKCKPCAAR